MDSARDFDPLGESGPQVRVSARTLTLLGFFRLVIYSDSILSGIYVYKYIYTYICMYFPLTHSVSFFFLYILYSGVGTDLVDSRELSGMGT